MKNSKFHLQKRMIVTTIICGISAKLFFFVSGKFGNFHIVSAFWQFFTS